MLRKPAPEPVKRVIIRPEIKKCLKYGTTLVKKRHKDRIVWTFGGPGLGENGISALPYPECKMHGVEIRPTRSLAPPRLTYSKEVVVEMIIMREKEKKREKNARGDPSRVG